MPHFHSGRMHLIQLLLPLRGNAGRPFSRAEYERIHTELTDRFGGVTAHLQAPAAGAWRYEEGEVEHDQIVIVEVLASELDRVWWKRYREELERRFQQDTLLVRALACDTL